MLVLSLPHDKRLVKGEDEGVLGLYRQTWKANMHLIDLLIVGSAIAFKKTNSKANLT